MKNLPAPFVLWLLVSAFAVLNVPAAQPSLALLHSLFDPSTNAQAGAQQGYSVALDGNIAVTGAPYDRVGADVSGVVKVYDVTTGALLYTLTNPSPAALDSFGHSVAVSGLRVVVGAPSDDTGAIDAGSAYVYDLTSAAPSVPVATLINPKPAIDDFGSSVAICGTRVLVGAYREDTGAYNAGSAYVYDLAGASPPVPALTLTNPSPTFSGEFGYSVAISGRHAVVGTHAGRTYAYDLASATPTVPTVTLSQVTPSAVAVSDTRIVIGARNGVFEFSGSAYVYDLASATPTVPVVTLANPTPGLSELFGDAVAISGTRVVIGAYRDSPGAAFAGSAYVYDLNSATPTAPVLTLNNPSPEFNDSFGFSVAISGTRAVAGAYLDDTGAANAGNAYVYDLTSTTPAQPAVTLNSPSPAIQDYFGHAVAVSGTRLIVGATSDDTGGANSGSAFVYDLAGPTPTLPVAILKSPSPVGGDSFGGALAASGTLVVVGAHQTDLGAENAGSAYVYDLSSTTSAVSMLTLTNPTPGGHDWFGGSVSLSGARVLVGAYGDDTGVNNTGCAYVYDLAGATPAVPMITLTNPSPAPGDAFGISVALAGTLAVVGAMADAAGIDNAGAVYVFDLAGALPTVPVITLTNPSPAGFDVYGFSVAISGTRMLVGAFQDNARASDDTGSAYVYDLASALPAVPVLTLTNPSPVSYDLFGYSVAISGTRMVVGAYQNNSGAEDAGRAYVFDLTSATPAVPVAALDNPSPAASDWFGYSVSMDGATIVAGAPFVDSNTLDRGAAYVFGLVSPVLRMSGVPGAPGLLTLSWMPTQSPGFVLQYADRVAPAHWVNAPSGATNPVTVSATNAARFYRVVQP